MSESRHINSQSELEQLIDRYFDGETTVQEEHLLRQAITDGHWHGEKVDEARVVMGYFAAHRQQQRHLATKSSRQRIIGIAATIALILTVGGYALWHQLSPANDICIAYVNGEVVQNDDKVMAMIASDMSMIDNADDVMTNQLSSLGEALELDNE